MKRGGCWSGETGNGLLAKGARELFGNRSSILLLVNVLDGKGRTLEDLVPREVYATAAHPSDQKCPLTAKEKREAGNLESVQRVFRRKGWGNFDADRRSAVAMKLASGWLRDPRRIPAYTRKVANELFAAINERVAQD